MAQSVETRNAEQGMLGAVPRDPAVGRGPSAWGGYSRHNYAAAVWGAASGVSRMPERAVEPVESVRAIFVVNDEDGAFDCAICAWPDDPEVLRLDIRENRRFAVTLDLVSVPT
jgi:hypothetical protein